MAAMDLSIVIVTYNGRELALRTIERYLAAISFDPSHSYELVVVDNASQDGVADAVAERFAGVRLLRSAANGGFAAGNNAGYAVSTGRYLLFSNPDIEVTDETLPALLKLMDEQPAVGACTPLLKLAGSGQIDWGAHRGFPTPWAAFTYFTRLARLFRRSRRLSGLFGRYHLLDRDLSQAHAVDVIRGGFFFVRREAFERAGRWDEDYFMFGEDIDLCFQLRRLGYAVMFYPQALAWHHHGATTGIKGHSQSQATVDAGARARSYHAFYDTMKLFYDKNYRARYGRLTRALVFAAIEAKRRVGLRSGTV
jgi:GT2 family glycosyltransferase